MKLARNSAAEKLETFNLTAKNPNGKKDLVHKPPDELVREIEGKEGEIVKILEEIKSMDL